MNESKQSSHTLVSKELEGQMYRLLKTGAFVLSVPQKRELQTLLNELELRPLTNLECGTCVRNALYDLHAYISRKNETPKLQMQMVKGVDEMSYIELKQYAKAKGIKAGRVKKTELIKIIEEHGK